MTATRRNMLGLAAALPFVALSLPAVACEPGRAADAWIEEFLTAGGAFQCIDRQSGEIWIFVPLDRGQRAAELAQSCKGDLRLDVIRRVRERGLAMGGSQ